MVNDGKAFKCFHQMWNSTFSYISLLCLIIIYQLPIIYAQENRNQTKTIHYQFELNDPIHSQPLPPEVNKSWFEDVNKNIHASGKVIPKNKLHKPSVPLGDPLSATPDWFTSYIQQEDSEFGYAVANAGDINLDGYDDVLVGIPHYSNGETSEGAVFIYYGASGGLSTIAGDVLESNIEFALMGRSLSTAGDINNDSIDDIVVGLPGIGEVYIYYGSLSSIDTYSPNLAMSTAEKGDVFGNSVACAGDVNGDGYDDVIVGAPYYGENNGGAAFLYYGSDFGFAGGTWAVYFHNSIIYENAIFGNSVSSAGDVNGDGYDDVIIGATNYKDGVGDAFLYYGSANGLSYTWGWSAPFYYNKVAYFGHVASAGDINNDGYDDVVIGAEYYGSHMGAVFVWYGHSWGLSAASAEWSFVNSGSDVYIGHSVSGAGDINGDGYDDIIAGAFGYSKESWLSGEGEAHVFLGSSEGIQTPSIWSYENTVKGAWMGWSVSSAGDVNNDGFDDVIMGAPGKPLVPSGTETFGRAYAFYGSSGSQSDFERFRFDDGTLQNWTLQTHYGQFFTGAIWWDRSNYPRYMQGDPVGNNEGSVTFSTSGWTIDTGDLPGLITEIVSLESPDLTNFGEWQSITGFTAQIMEFCSRNVVPVYAKLRATVLDNAQNHESDFLGSRKLCQYSNWTHLSINWSDFSNFPSDFTIKKVKIIICAEEGDYIEGGVWIDNVLPTVETDYPAPTNVITLNGYNGSIPIVWDPPETGQPGPSLTKPDPWQIHVQPDVTIDHLNTSMKNFKKTSDLIGYDIYRSQSATGTYTKVAEQLTNQYYRDSSVSNGQYYYYQVKALYNDGESAFSLPMLGRASENGYTILSRWAAEPPNLNGIIDEEEWSDARKLLIRTKFTLDTVFLYIMNDDENLYFAMDDRNDTSLDHGDQIYFFFDQNHDWEWPESTPGGEGNFRVHWDSGLNSAVTMLRRISGYWPDGLVYGDYESTSGVNQEISTHSGHLQYEVQIDLDGSLLNISPGEMVGAVFGAYNFGESKFDAAWPQEAEALRDLVEDGVALWGKYPFAFGDLRLASLTDINLPVFSDALDIQSPGQSFWLDINVGSIDVSAMDLFGISFNLNFTNTQYVDVVTPYSTHVVPGDLLGSDVVFVSTVNETNGTASISNSRKSGQGGVNGYGTVSRIQFQTVSNIPSGTEIFFTISDIAAYNSTGGEINIDPQSFTVTIEGLQIWPGDTDNNGTVNQADVLPLGLHWGKTGPARESASLTWAGQSASAWSPETATYADANGNGSVDQEDVLPIGLNWSKVHTGPPSQNQKLLAKGSTNNSLEIIVEGDANPGDDFYIDVYANNVTNLYGLGFELVYNPNTFLDPINVEGGLNNLLGDDLLFVSNINKETSTIGVGMSEKSGEGVDGSGRVSRILCHMSESAVTGQSNTLLSMQNLAANTPDGSPIQFDGTDYLLITGGEVIQVNGWKVQISEQEGDLNSVDAVSSQIAWIAGSNGVILRTTNGGEIWNEVGQEIDLTHFASIDALDEQTAFVAGWKSLGEDAYTTAIYRTTSGGVDWTKTFELENGFLNGIKMFDQNQGIAYGDPLDGTWTIITTDNGGESWSQIETAPARIDEEYSYLNGMSWTDEMNGWFATRYARAYHTTNGGSSWTTVNVPPLNKVYTLAFNQDGIGLASQSANGLMARTLNDGDTWESISSPTTNSIKNITYHNSTFWLCAGPDIFKSSDNGDNWTLELTTSSDLRHFSFLTNESQTTGWAVGTNGTVVKYNLISTPVKLKTDPPQPVSLNLLQNYPNPFNPETTIQFKVEQPGILSLEIYNLNGQRIETLTNKNYTPGIYEIQWNAENHSSGIYLCRFTSGQIVKTRKLILQK